MIAPRCFAGRKVALFGLGGSGLSTAHALTAGGADVAAWDDSASARARAGAAGIAIVEAFSRGLEKASIEVTGAGQRTAEPYQCSSTAVAARGSMGLDLYISSERTMAPSRSSPRPTPRPA